MASLSTLLLAVGRVYFKGMEGSLQVMPTSSVSDRAFSLLMKDPFRTMAAKGYLPVMW